MAIKYITRTIEDNDKISRHLQSWIESEFNKPIMINEQLPNNANNALGNWLVKDNKIYYISSIHKTTHVDDGYIIGVDYEYGVRMFAYSRKLNYKTRDKSTDNELNAIEVHMASEHTAPDLLPIDEIINGGFDIRFHLEHAYQEIINYSLYGKDEQDEQTDKEIDETDE